MYIVIGVLSIAILIFICILVNYKRQIKDICRQLRFLQEHDDYERNAMGTYWRADRAFE